MAEESINLALFDRLMIKKSRDQR